jgi:O-antigen ligase
MYYTTINPRKLRILGVYRYIVVGGIIILSAIAGILVWRQSDIQGLENLSGGSFSQRMIIAYVGLKVFIEHPFIGIGWQASSVQNATGSIEASQILTDRFLDLGIPGHFLLGATSFHNMYIQFLAELGLVGSALFIYVCFRIRYVIQRTMKDICYGSQYLHMSYFYTLGMIFLLIWWNTNALFGGQIETVLAFTFLSMESTITRIRRKQINYNN